MAKANWLDYALEVGGATADWDAEKRNEQLETRFKELADNKELYRALATTRYSKDLDKYYKEVEKYDNLKDVYSTIQSANGGKGMDKNQAARKIIFADPELFAEWNSYGTAKGSLAAKEAMVSRVMNGFKDRTVDGKVVGYEFSHPGLELTSPQQEDYFQDANYWAGLADEIRNKTSGPLTNQLLKAMGKEPAEVNLDQLEQKSGTDIKESIDNQIYTSSNTDKSSGFSTSGSSGILKTEFDTDGINEKVHTLAAKNKDTWISKSVSDQEMFSILSQMPDNWIDTYLVKESFNAGEIRFKAGGEAVAQQARALWRDVVNFHYENTFYTDGIFGGEGKELTNNFSFQNIINTFREEFEKRNITIENDPDNPLFPDELWELLTPGAKDFKVSYLIDSDLLPYYVEGVVDGKEVLMKPDVDEEGLKEHLNAVVKEWTSKGEKGLRDKKGLEQLIRAETKNYYKNILPKKREEESGPVEIEITEDMIRSQMEDHDKTREEVIKDFQENPIKSNKEGRKRKFIFPDDFDYEGSATLEDEKNQEKQINQANKLPFRVDGPLNYQEWLEATAEEVYNAYVPQDPLD